MEVTRLFDLLPHMLQNHPKPDALNCKINGEWKGFTTQQYADTATDLSYGLLTLGLDKNDKVAIISNSRPEWNFVDMALLQSGLISAPIYPTVADADLQFILNDAEIKLVFVSNNGLYDKIKAVAANVPSIKEIYTIDPVVGAKHWLELVNIGKNNRNEAKLNEIKNNIKSEDLATLIYTSGTTGNPKGVMLSHSNLLQNVMNCKKLMPTDHNGRALSFLPLNHVYERMLIYMYMYMCIPVYYAESLDTIGDNIRETHPHIFCCVPRLIEKVFDRIMNKGRELTGVKKKLFFWAVALGEQYDPAKSGGLLYNIQLALANKLIFSKWREALGGEVRCMVSGGAALNPRLARIFWAAKIPVLEGYGLTETSPVIAVNYYTEPNCIRIGTVGPVINGLDVKIAEDGEILVKGHCVMMGYYKRPDVTAEVIDSNGYFHTGDIGTFVEGRFLKITDRKKEIFKTSGGKYIAPQPIENKLKASQYVEQAMVVGESQKFPAAFIVPAFANIRGWAQRNGADIGDSNQAIASNPEVKKLIQREVEEVNKTLSHYEAIKKIELLPAEFTVDKGELTPKLSLKRKAILEKNKEAFTKIYGEGS